MGVLYTDTESKSDTLRIHISEAYLAGREAFADGLDYYQSNPYGVDRYAERLDFFIGWSDAHDCVSIEFRALAESNGERV